jgi:predicted nucleic acid-binding protein
MKPMRIYLDTSAVGGCEDVEFMAPSRALFALAAAGAVRLVVSDLLVAELADAPEPVRRHLEMTDPASVIKVVTSEEAVVLCQRYLAAKVVGPASANDALHVAIATVAGAEVVASWNFKHIVHLDKVRGFNAVNLVEGYPPIDIRSPLELI